MPRTILEGFDDFSSWLTPSERETEAAIAHRESVFDVLKKNFYLRHYFQSGSFGNGTSVSTYSDVDYLCSFEIDRPRSAEYFVRSVRDVLAGRFPATNISVKKPAIEITFNNEVMDLVPAIYVGKRKSFRKFLIVLPGGVWKEASPEAHKTLVKTWDDTLNCRVRPFIRLLKAWKYYASVPLSSFYIEMRAIHYIQNRKTLIYPDDLARFFNYLLSVNLAMVRDPLHISGFIQSCKSSSSFTQSLSKTRMAYSRASKAVSAAERGDIKGAFEWWNKVYDGGFMTFYK